MVQDIIEEVKKVKEMTDIGLYSEIEAIKKAPINIKNIKANYNRDELEKFVLENRLKALPKVKEVVPEKVPTPVPPAVENEDVDEAAAPPADVEEEKGEPTTGGMLKKATKKELVLAINKS